MDTWRGWLILIGLTLFLLLGGGLYFLAGDRKPVVPNHRPSLATNIPVSTSSFGGSLVPDGVPAPQHSGDSLAPPAYRYNAQGLLAAIIYPDGSTYTYGYDAYGDKIRETDGAGKTWSYTYDQNHHPTIVIDPEGHVMRKMTAP